MKTQDIRANIKRAFPLPEDVLIASIAGPADFNLKLLQSIFGVIISGTTEAIFIEGAHDDVESALLIIEDIVALIRDKQELDENVIRGLVSSRQQSSFTPPSITSKVILNYKGKSIRPKTSGQKKYIEAISNNTITFGIGPAGTGKTYLAMACAIAAFHSSQISRIVLCRPIIEAGESLGFLPGTLTEKVDPYIRPLYDALYDMVNPHEANSLLQEGAIEVAPLAFMRGRTLNESFIILDEAQNTTPEQMKMFLTRLGHGSKMVITGDLTQSDLPNKSSGLSQALQILTDVNDVEICQMKPADVVRHPLVGAIIAAYEKRGL